MGMPPYPATTVAKWFISWAEAREQELSSAKLQKLLNRAERHYLARYGRSLLVQPMPAWSPGGPVLPQTGSAVQTAGACPAGPADDDARTRHDVDPATARFLGEVWDSYGGCFADVRLVIPATHQHLRGTAPNRDQVPVGGTA
jgi:uncharacterized phage-associated protein